MTSTTAGDKVRQAGESDWLEKLARVGLIAYGVVHLLIGWLALQIAWGGSSGMSADPSGAFKTLASQPFGEAVLWLLISGLVSLAFWQAGEAIWGHRRRDTGERLGKQAISGARAVIYAVLGYTAASVALGSGSSSSQSQRQATAGVLDWPGGQVIVVVAGLVVIGVGAAHVFKGIKQTFLEDLETSKMSRSARKATRRLGTGGYVAKGAALGVVGALLAYAAVSHERGKVGLDGALQTMAEQPYGKFLLSAVAAGFVAYGLFTLMQSRYRRM